jgi:hypothetical protein
MSEFRPAGVRSASSEKAGWTEYGPLVNEWYIEIYLDRGITISRVNRYSEAIMLVHGILGIVAT